MIARARRLAALAAAAAVLAGCASIPHTSEVQQGNADVLPVAPLQPIQEGPNPSDDPAAIVTGFLTASAGGVASDFSVAREFLTESAAASWDPAAQTRVYRSGAVTPEWDEDANTVTYAVPLASTVDESGRRADSPDGTVAELSFTVAQDSAGRWRISELEDGVVISQANFTRFFRPVDLVFATADLTTAVPEIRWLADNNVVTSAARELVEGPSTWLADAVRTGFPATATLAVESVVVTDGTASVDLTPQSAGTPEDRALAAEQMRATLEALPNVTDVEVRIGGLPFASDAPIVLASAPVPEPRAVAIAGGRLGSWDGDELRVTADAVGGVGQGAYGVARAYADGEVAYVQGGALHVTDAVADTVLLVARDPEAPSPEAALESTVLLTGDDLVAPSYDRHGYLWTAEAEGGAGIVAVAPDAAVTSLASEWAQTRSIVGVSVSRDGARIALLSRSGGQPVLEVAGVIRDETGAPVAIGEHVQIGTGVGAGVDVLWVDQDTIGVLGEPVDGASSPLWLVDVGGGTSTVGSVPDAVDATARAGEATLLVVSADGRVDERSGTAWALVLEGVDELAYSG